MCERCDAYADCVAVASPDDLDALLVQAATAVHDEDLEVLDLDPGLRARRSGSPLPAAPARGRWVCAQCSRVFLLELGACTTLGDGWRPLFGN